MDTFEVGKKGQRFVCEHRWDVLSNPEKYIFFKIPVKEALEALKYVYARYYKSKEKGTEKKDWIIDKWPVSANNGKQLNLSTEDYIKLLKQSMAYGGMDFWAIGTDNHLHYIEVKTEGNGQYLYTNNPRLTNTFNFKDCGCLSFELWEGSHKGWMHGYLYSEEHTAENNNAAQRRNDLDQPETVIAAYTKPDIFVWVLGMEDKNSREYKPYATVSFDTKELFKYLDNQTEGRLSGTDETWKLGDSWLEWKKYKGYGVCDNMLYAPLDKLLQLPGAKLKLWGNLEGISFETIRSTIYIKPEHMPYWTTNAQSIQYKKEAIEARKNYLKTHQTNTSSNEEDLSWSGKTIKIPGITDEEMNDLIMQHLLSEQPVSFQEGEDQEENEHQQDDVALNPPDDVLEYIEEIVRKAFREDVQEFKRDSFSKAGINTK